jgi:BA14K-like protein
LVPGMTLSTGNTLGANVWQVPATDLANTWVGPPTDFVGIVDLIAEVQLADATIIHRQPIQIEWVATNPAVAAHPAVAAQVPTTAPQPEAVPAPQQLEQAETAMEGSEDPTARIEQHGGAVAAQGIVEFILPRRRSTEVPERASQMSTETRAQHCNFAVCARFYRSFDPSDCSYQPYYSGARKTCDR